MKGRRYMRKFSLLGLVVGLLVLAIPAGAGANQVTGYGTGCSWANSQSVAPANNGTVDVYAGGTGSTGNAGTTAAGACVNVNGNGGVAEVGADPTKGQAYAVADGLNSNPDPGDGYVGVSNYEDGASGGGCNGGGAAGSTNSGGCGGIKPVGPFPGTGDVPGPFPFICGNTSSPDWNSTQRDGCFIP
jgi:hypothetical protein